MRQSLALVTPPAVEPVTVAEAKAWAQITGGCDDDVIKSLITAARQAVEEYLRRSLVTQTWKLTLDLSCDREQWWDGVRDGAIASLYGGLPRVIPLPRGPVQSVASVVTYDLTNTPATFAAPNYRLDASGDRLILNYGAVWPATVRPEAGCEITYAAGFGPAGSDVPQPIRQAIAAVAAGFLATSDLAGGIQTMKAGDATITRFADGAAFDTTTKALLGPYRRLRL